MNYKNVVVNTWKIGSCIHPKHLRSLHYIASKRFAFLNEKQKSKNIIKELCSIFQLNSSDDNSKELSIKRSAFDSKGLLLVLETDYQQRKTIYLSYAFSAGIALILFYYFHSEQSKRGNKPMSTKSKLSLAGGIIMLCISISLLKNSSFFIKRIYLKDCGKQIVIEFFPWSSKQLDIKQFIRLKPINDYISKAEFAVILDEGFPVIINQKMYVISKQSKIFNKRALAEIGKKNYISVEN